MTDNAIYLDQLAQNRRVLAMGLLHNLLDDAAKDRPHRPGLLLAARDLLGPRPSSASFNAAWWWLHDHDPEAANDG